MYCFRDSDAEKEACTMISFFYVYFVFGIALVLHIIIHRVGIRSIKNSIVFGFGYFFISGVSSIVIYSLLSLLWVILYLTPLLGGESPTSMILESFKKKRQQTASDLVNLFTNTGLIWKRIDDLRSSGLIVKNGAGYVVTMKGNMVARCIIFYQSLFNRRLTG